MTDGARAAPADGAPSIGAIVTFVGLVRADGETGPVWAMTLEHYPGMTERMLAGLEKEARSRWPLQDVRIVHRVGRLEPGEPIVFVAAASAHRAAAFEGCAFLIDGLKTDAPFWKLEEGPSGSHWVAARDADRDRADHWRTSTAQSMTSPGLGRDRGDDKEGIADG